MSKELAIVISNKVNVGKEYTQVVELAGQNVQYYEYSADNMDAATSQIQFSNIVPIGALSSCLLSRNMKIRYQLTISVTNPGGAVHYNFPHVKVADDVASPVNSSIRAFALQSISDTVQLSLNSSTTTWNARQTCSALQRLLDKNALMYRACESPCRPDNQYLLLTDAIGVCHPQSTSQNAFYSYSRNSIKPTSYTVAGNLSTYVFDITEDLVIPGINTLYDNETYLPNINNLSLILSFSKLNDLFTSAPLYNSATPPVFTPYTDTIALSITKPYLVLAYQQLDPNLISVPKSYVTNYEYINYFPQLFNNVDMQTTTPISVASQVIRCQSLPKRLGVFFRQQISSRTSVGGTTSAYGDSCFALTPDKACFQLNIGNRSGLFAQCSRDQMWRLSVEAGSNQTRDDFCTGSGSFVWLDLTTQAGVNAESGDLMVGENGSINISVSATYTAQNAQTNIPVGCALNASGLPGANTPSELIIICIYEGQMVISPEQVMYNLGILTETEVNALTNAGKMVSKEAIVGEIKGAGLYTPKGVLSKGARKNKGGVMTMA